MKLIAGLGNPGSQYEGTRHNVGFDCVQAMAARLGAQGAARRSFGGMVVQANAPGTDGREEKVLLLRPWTFMNRSGESVQAAMGFYQIGLSDLMIVVDDMALPAGGLRMRAEGSSGGHNGLKDIERALGTRAYPRLRIGIDPPPGRMAAEDYVLAAFSKAQRELVDQAVDRALDALMAWIEKGIGPAMSLYNADVQEP